MATFAELGIPFPLFEAPTTEASDYVGLATCRLCGGRECHCFELGTGDSLILPCPACGVGNGLSAGDRAATPCRSCGSTVPFPDKLKTRKQLLVCYDCLRGGKAAMTKSTEFGMVRGRGHSRVHARCSGAADGPDLRLCPWTPTKTGMPCVSRAGTHGNCSARPASIPGRRGAGCSVVSSQ